MLRFLNSPLTSLLLGHPPSKRGGQEVRRKTVTPLNDYLQHQRSEYVILSEGFARVEESTSQRYVIA